MARLEELPRARIAGALEYIRDERPLRYIREGRNRLIIWADIRKCLGLREKRPEDYGLRRGFDYITRYLHGYNCLPPMVVVVKERFLTNLRRRANFEKRQRQQELEMPAIEISDSESESE
jgi:hypothetical protein